MCRVETAKLSCLVFLILVLTVLLLPVPCSLSIMAFIRKASGEQPDHGAVGQGQGGPGENAGRRVAKKKAVHQEFTFTVPSDGQFAPHQTGSRGGRPSVRRAPVAAIAFDGGSMRNDALACCRFLPRGPCHSHLQSGINSASPV